jgi:hypothetical protein
VSANGANASGANATIVAECEDENGTRRNEFSGEIHAYADWRLTHSGHGHLVQTSREVDDTGVCAGPAVRYSCTCGQTYHAPASSSLLTFFAWCRKHRKHGIRGDIS